MGSDNVSKLVHEAHLIFKETSIHEVIDLPREEAVVFLNHSYGEPAMDQVERCTSQGQVLLFDIFNALNLQNTLPDPFFYPYQSNEMSFLSTNSCINAILSQNCLREVQSIFQIIKWSQSRMALT